MSCALYWLQARRGKKASVPFSFSRGIRSDLRQVLKHAQVAELVDALVSGASVERRAGSIPVLGT